MNTDTFRTLLLDLIASAAIEKAAPPLKRHKPQPTPSVKARLTKQPVVRGRAKAAPKAASSAATASKAQRAIEGIDCGGVEFRKGASTKQGREYVLIYIRGAFAGSLRVDDTPLLGKALAGLRHADAATAIALACE